MPLFFHNMKLIIKDDKTGGHLALIHQEAAFDRLYLGRDRTNKHFTIAWNPGPAQKVKIDGDEFEFPSNTLLTLLFDQSFHFEDASVIIAWQFNREFYCILDHDSEVSCVGFLFGSTDHLFISLSTEAQQRLKLLFDIFSEELKTNDTIQNEMLLALLKRLIKFITGLAKAEFVPDAQLKDEKFSIIRKFNLLVEANFKTERSVSFYASQLFKSPKTLSNLFAIYNHKSPSQVIQERVLIEAKRLLAYTDKPVKTIAWELGFEDMPHFSNFFKKQAQVSPLEFRNNRLVPEAGK